MVTGVVAGNSPRIPGFAGIDAGFGTTVTVLEAQSWTVSPSPGTAEAVAPAHDAVDHVAVSDQFPVCREKYAVAWAETGIAARKRVASAVNR